jgi:hypothetical protein
LHSGLHIFKASALLLEPHLQSILLWLFWRWGSRENYLPRLALNHNLNPPNLNLSSSSDYKHKPLAPLSPSFECRTKRVCCFGSVPQRPFVKGLVTHLWYYLEVVELLEGGALGKEIRSLGLCPYTHGILGHGPPSCLSHQEVNRSSLPSTPTMMYYVATGPKQQGQVTIS